jgi:D-alanyl-D-alanine carboxypeptidase
MIHSTDQLVMKGDVDVQAGKTGFISKAGYCLATLLRLPQGGPEVAVVVLGAKSNPGRFWETRHLFNWISTKATDWFGSTDANYGARRMSPIERLEIAMTDVARIDAVIAVGRCE